MCVYVRHAMVKLNKYLNRQSKRYVELYTHCPEHYTGNVTKSSSNKFLLAFNNNLITQCFCHLNTGYENKDLEVFLTAPQLIPLQAS